LCFNQTGRTRYCSSGPAGFDSAAPDRTRARVAPPHHRRARCRSCARPPPRRPLPRLSAVSPPAAALVTALPPLLPPAPRTALEPAPAAVTAARTGHCRTRARACRRCLRLHRAPPVSAQLPPRAAASSTAAVATSQTPPHLPEHLLDPVNSLDVLTPAADDRCAAASSASVSHLPRARQRSSGDGGRRRTYRRAPLLETQPLVQPRASAVAGVACGDFAGGGGAV
jgi:hypothetical protein